MIRFQVVISTVLAISASAAFGAPVDFVGSSAPVAIEKTTQIPGDTLKSGSYSISITEQIADRMIVRINNTNSANHAIFLAVPSSAARMGGSTGLVTWPNGVNKTPTVRGFVFPNGNAIEFVYPKAEAAALAKENSAPVVAVDPQSEGRVALKNLSHDELEIVNLWLLSLTSSGPDNKTPAILAKHYDPTQDMEHPTVASGVAPVYPIGQRHGSATQIQAAVAPVITRPAMKPAPVVAQRTPVATTATIAKVTPRPEPVPQTRRVRVAPSSSNNAPETARLEQPSSPNDDLARRGPAISQLPHTAGFLPEVWMLGMLSLLGFVAVRFGRPSSRRIES